MKIPYLLKPFGFPKDLPLTSRNVKIWIRKEFPGTFQLYNPVQAVSSSVGIVSALTGIYGWFKENGTAKKWGGWAFLASVISSLGSVILNGTLGARFSGVPSGDYEKNATDKKGEFINALTNLYTDSGNSFDNVEAKQFKSIFDKHPKYKEWIVETISSDKIKDHHEAENEVKACIECLFAIDDKDIPQKLAPILMRRKEKLSPYSFYAEEALIKIEKTFNDSRTIPTIISIIENDGGTSAEEFAEKLNNKDLVNYLFKNLEDPTNSKFTEWGQVYATRGLIYNGKSLEEDSKLEILCKIIEGKLSNPGAKKAIFESLWNGYPDSDKLIEILLRSVEKLTEVPQISMGYSPTRLTRDFIMNKHKQRLQQIKADQNKA